MHLKLNPVTCSKRMFNVRENLAARESEFLEIGPGEALLVIAFEGRVSVHLEKRC